MKRVVIDTHALIWHLSKPARLGASAKRTLRAADSGKATILIPAIVLVELALLREIGRRVVGPVEVEALVAQSSAFEVLPLDLAQSKEFMMLGGLRDPFDRMIASAARTLALPILSADEKNADSGLVDVVWN